MSTVTAEKTKFNVDAGKLITFDIADKLTSNHREAVSADKNAIHSFFFGKNQILNLLDQTEAEGIRIHLGMDEHGVQKLVLMPADGNGLNIYVKNEEGIDSALDYGLPCPPHCPVL